MCFHYWLSFPVRSLSRKGTELGTPGFLGSPQFWWGVLGPRVVGNPRICWKSAAWLVDPLGYAICPKGGNIFTSENEGLEDDHFIVRGRILRGELLNLQEWRVWFDHHPKESTMLKWGQWLPGYLPGYIYYIPISLSWPLSWLEFRPCSGEWTSET